MPVFAPDSVGDIDSAVMDRGDAALAGPRGKLFRQWVKESSAVRQPLKKASREILASLDNVTFTRGRIDIRSRDEFLRVGFRAIDDAVDVLEDQLDVGVGRAIRRAQRAQVEQLKKLGVKPPSASERRALRRQVLSMVDDEFPAGSGKSVKDRLRVLRASRKAQLRKAINQRAPHDKLVQKVRRGVGGMLADRPPGPVSGGSAARHARLFIVAEETRLANQIEVLTLQSAGVDFVYWRLNPAHKFNGREVCEWFASRTMGSTLAALDRQKVPPSSVDVGGLYIVSEYPSYPHPNCKCFPEPWIP